MIMAIRFESWKREFNLQVYGVFRILQIERTLQNTNDQLLLSTTSDLSGRGLSGSISNLCNLTRLEKM